VAHLHFSNSTKAKQKMQKSYQANAPKKVQAMNEINITNRTPACNKVLPKWRQKYYYEAFMLNSTAVILLKFSANTPPLRQYPARYLHAKKISLLKH